MVIYYARYVFHYSRFVRDTGREEDSAVAIRSLNLREILVIFSRISHILLSWYPMWKIASWYHYFQLSFFSFYKPLFCIGYIVNFIYLFVCARSGSYLMSYIAVVKTIFLGLIFRSFEPYPNLIIFTLKIYQLVVLKVVQLFPVSNLFPSSLWLKSVSDLAYPNILVKIFIYNI